MSFRFSLRRCEPYQVPRDSLNSFQNTPKAFTNIHNYYTMVPLKFFSWISIKVVCYRSNTVRLNPIHINPYMALFQFWNTNYFKPEFLINRD